MIYLLANLILLSPIIEKRIHNEVVAELRINNFKNELYVEVVVDKRMLTTALIMEADCTPSDMVKVCGGQYIKDHIWVSVNGQPVEFEQQSTQLYKTQVLYNFYLGDLGEDLKNIEVETDYMFKYHEHSIIKVKMSIEDTIKSYNLTANKRRIESQIL